tara:strand:- start:3070 stop:4350 length:1281 start_codon:yes stop_codon:yes gene_type:complete
MALVDLKTNLAEKIGGTNTDDGTFKTKQGDNTERTSQLTGFERPEVNTIFNRLAPAPSDDLLSTLTSGLVGRVVSQFRGVAESAGFLASPKGALFIARQDTAQKKNKFSFTKRYDALSVPKALASEINEVPRHMFGNKSFTLGDDKTELRGTVANENTTLEDLQPVNQAIIFRSNRGIRKTPGRRISTKISDERVSWNLSADVLGFNNYYNVEGLPKDFIKFYINDVTTDKVIQFPAYLNDITDNSSAEFNPTRYIGRADQVYVYSGYSRNISFGFRVAALTRGDIPMMWKKIDHLKQLTLPSYQTNVIQNDNEERPIAPIVELTIGDLYKEQPGFFSSVNITMPQSSNWETEDGFQVTHICDVSVEFTFIGKRVPQLAYSPQLFEYTSFDTDLDKAGFRDQPKTPSIQAPSEDEDLFDDTPFEEL